MGANKNIKRLYIIGAGFNKNIKYDEEKTSIPLANDFFTSFVNKKSLKKYLSKYEEVFDYIKKFWNIEYKEIEKGRPINLEELLSELEFKSIIYKNNEYFASIKKKIEEMIYYLFSSYEFTSYNYPALEVLRFGEKFIKENNSDIITFNYDNIIERVIEIESGSNKLTEKEKEIMKRNLEKVFEEPIKNNSFGKEEFLKSKYKFNRILSYFVKFDILTKEFFHSSDFSTKHITKEYYVKNKLYSNHLILKLHGSIGWFYIFKNIRKFLYNDDMITKDFSNGDFFYTTFNVNTPDEEVSLEEKRDLFDYWGARLEPLLITPTIFKNYTDKRILGLWNKAVEKIKTADEIIIIGYSFPSTDLFSKIILSENIKDNTVIKIVNPDNKIVDHLTKNVLHRKKIKIEHFPLLKDYLDSEKIPSKTIHLILFKKDNKILNYTIDLEYFNGKELKSKKVSMKGINANLEVIKYNGEIPVDFKEDSDFYLKSGKIIKKIKE